MTEETEARKKINDARARLEGAIKQTAEWASEHPQLLDWLMYAVAGYYGYKAVNKYTGGNLEADLGGSALGMISLKLATSPNPISGTAGIVGLAGIGLAVWLPKEIADAINPVGVFGDAMKVVSDGFASIVNPSPLPTIGVVNIENHEPKSCSFIVENTSEHEGTAWWGITEPQPDGSHKKLADLGSGKMQPGGQRLVTFQFGPLDHAIIEVGHLKAQAPGPLVAWMYETDESHPVTWP